MGFQWASLCGRPFEVRVPLDFQICCNSFVKARLEARGIKTLTEIQMFYPQNHRASGLPIKIYCLILGFQWASPCGRPSEVSVSSIFQAYSNPFVKDGPEASPARGI